MAHCERLILLIKGFSCPFCDMLLVPILAVKALSACYLTHTGTPPPMFCDCGKKIH